MVRAKLKDTYEWVFSDNENTIYSYDIIPETICHNIEMIDQSGKNVFENDIVACDCGKSIGWFIASKWIKVAYEKARMNAAIHNDDEKKFTRLESSYVIGNVFDNPDLLETLEIRTKEQRR